MSPDMACGALQNALDRLFVSLARSASRQPAYRHTKVDALGLKIAGHIGSTLAWFGPEAPERMEALADEVERELRRLVPDLPKGLGSP